MSNRLIRAIRFAIVLVAATGIQACSDEETTNVPIAHVSDCKEFPIYEMFDSLEVINLDAQPEALLSRTPQFIDCQDYFIIECHPNFYIFDKSGAFVASSERILGHGYGETPNMVGCSYNPYSKQIEILSFGQLLKYDIHLNFISKHPLPYEKADSKDLNNKPGSWFQYIYDLSPTKHLLMTGKTSPNNLTAFIYDSQVNKISGQIPLDGKVLANYGSYQKDCFFRDSAQTYLFSPCIANNFFFSLDEESLSLSPVLQLDFGNNTLQNEDLEPYRSQDYLQNQDRIYSYLHFKCDKHYPMISAETNHKLFSLIHGSTMMDNWYLLEVDLSTLATRRFTISEGNNNLIFPSGFSAANGYIFGIDNDAESVHRCIAAFQHPDRIKYSGISDTLDCTNAVVLKYKVK